MAEPFSAAGQGTHRGGVVVRFSPATGTRVGNFQRGFSSLDEVFAHPDGRHVVVVAPDPGAPPTGHAISATIEGFSDGNTRIQPLQFFSSPLAVAAERHPHPADGHPGSLGCVQPLV